MAQLLSQYKPLKRDLPFSVIPNWERADLFPSGEGIPTWNSPLATQLADHFVVLYLGNAGYGHEFETIIAAAQQLRNEPVIFLFVGGGSRHQWLQGQRATHNLGNILLHDYLPPEEVRPVMQTAGCALITLETQMAGVMSPSKLHANLAAGLPILYIGPPQTNVDEAVTKFACGASLRPGQVIETVAFIQSLRHNPQKQADLTQASWRAFSAAYNDRQTLAAFDNVLEFVGG